jgi:hypothetical protein
MFSEELMSYHQPRALFKSRGRSGRQKQKAKAKAETACSSLLPFAFLLLPSSPRLCY